MSSDRDDQAAESRDDNGTSGAEEESSPPRTESDSDSGNREKTSSILFNCGIVLLVALTAVLIDSRVDLLRSNGGAKEVANQVIVTTTVRPESVKPKYVLYNAHGKKDHLKHVEIVLQRFGYEEVSFNASSTDWTLMWAHDYPFNAIKTIDFKNLKPCQIVNHVPGCGFITNKVDLSTTRLKYVPRAFKLPKQKEELLSYATDHPEKLFVHKHNQHRHIKVRKLDEIDFADTNNFVQVFIDNPLLVDGYKFDIGVYTIITSVDPLRVYYYSGDILFRFCPVPYYPFDPENVDKYIVGDDYLPIWKVPSLGQFYNNLQHGMRDSFNLYIKSQGRDPQRIWDQIDESIRLMMYEKEKHLVDILKRYKNKRNFFELMRIDFVVDNNFNVFMMEANMSPNLSAAHYPPNQLLYEQVLYNALKLAGVAYPQQNESCSGSASVNQMMSSNKNFVVNGEKCVQCIESCAAATCQLCHPCLSASQKHTLLDTVSEHINRGDTRRVIPAPVKILRSYVDNDWNQLSENNRFLARWFVAKCDSSADSSWCY